MVEKEPSNPDYEVDFYWLCIVAYYFYEQYLLHR